MNTPDLILRTALLLATLAATAAGQLPVPLFSQLGKVPLRDVEVYGGNNTSLAHPLHDLDGDGKTDSWSCVSKRRRPRRPFRRLPWRRSQFNRNPYRF